jgi:acetyltransferase
LAARGVAKIPLDQPLQQGDERDPLPGDAEGRALEVDDQGFLVLQATRTRFSREETAGLIELARSAGVTVNGLISAAILLAEAECRRCPLTDLLYVYAVNLRGMVDPPVAPAEVTNMTGAASYASTDESPTELLALAQAIRSVLDAQVADCLPLQTPLHTGDDSAALVAPPSRFIVAATNVGRLPELPRPAGLHLEDYRITMLGKPIDTSGQVNSGTCIMNTFNARLGIEVHHSESAAEWERRRIERIKSVVLAAIR